MMIPERRSLRRLTRFLRPLAVASLLLASLAACTSNPATGRSSLPSLMSPQQEAQIGAQEHPKILQEFGGAYDDAKLGAYVTQITGRIMKTTHQPNQAYRVTILNTPMVNAFALPGGYVYVTRGLMALADSEAELAGVIGHEIGHVMARHSGQRQTAALGASILGAAVGILAGDPTIGQLANLGSQGAVASYSRSQELEADELGVKYLAASGYDPYAEAAFLRTMGAQSALHAKIARQSYDANSVDWLASHPATNDRVREATALARQTGMQPGQGEDGRDRYLKAINGMVYGDTPDQGYIRGRTFIHPKLRFEFTVPQGFALTNTAQAVFAEGPNGVKMKFDGAGKPASADIGTYLARGWAGNAQLSNFQQFQVNGLPAASAVTPASGYYMTLVAIQASQDKVYRFMFAIPPQAGNRYNGDIGDVVNSFRKISASQANRVKPLRIRSVTVRSGDTVAGLARRMAFSDYQEERFRVLNGLSAGEGLKAGQLVKIVTQ